MILFNFHNLKSRETNLQSYTFQILYCFVFKRFYFIIVIFITSFLCFVKSVIFDIPLSEVSDVNIFASQHLISIQ